MKQNRTVGHLLVTSTVILGAVGCAVESSDINNKRQGSICGGTTDWQDVESYDGSLGPSIEFVDEHQSPVGHLRPAGCSGTLIAPDLYLTAGHCVGGAVGSDVHFSYQDDPSGNPRTTDPYEVLEVVEANLGGVDFAILRLEGTPGETWGWTVPTAFAEASGQEVTIIQHPQGVPKVVEGGTLTMSGGLMTYDDLDTEGGSSGSGILQNATGNLIGVHTFGTWDDSCGVGDPNSGQPMLLVWENSATIRELALDTAKLTVVL